MPEKMLTIRLTKHSDPVSNGSPKPSHQRLKQISLSRRGHTEVAETSLDNDKTSRIKGSTCGDSHQAPESQKLSQSTTSKIEVSGVDIAGYKVVRRTGEKVHFCVICNFPIAVYGKLEPCLHAFCLTCAKAEKKCFLCGAEVLRVSSVNRLDGLSICGAPGCLQCFSDRPELIRHVRNTHQDLAQGTLHKLKAEAAVLMKGILATSTSKRPRTAEPAAKARGELSLSVSKAVVPSTLSDPVGGITPVASVSQPNGLHSSQQGPGHEHAGERSQQPKNSLQHHLIFPEPRSHMQGPPDFHPGHMGHVGMPGAGGPGMGPREMMGPMDGPGPGRPPWIGPMGPHPYVDHRPPYDAPFGNQHGPRGNFRPGVLDDFGYGWGMGNQNFGPAPAFGGGWRPTLQ